MPAEINDFVMKNLIYCEDTHSFTHRLYIKFQKEKVLNNTLTMQEAAWDVIKEMNEVQRAKMQEEL